MSKYQETKKFLSKVNKLDRLISVKLLEAEKHKMMAMNISSTIKQDVVQTSKENTFEKAMIAARTAEEEANALIEKLYQKREEINKMVQALDDEDVISVLTAHFLCGKTFEEMETILPMSNRTLYRVYERGLDMFEKKYGSLYIK